MTPGETGEFAERFVTLALLVALVSAAAVGGAAAHRSDAAVDDPRDSGATPLFAQHANNTTVLHENPDEVDEEKSISADPGLASQLGEQFSGSDDLSREDRERASQLIGNDSGYQELASQYSGTSGAGGGSSGEGTGGGDSDGNETAGNETDGGDYEQFEAVQTSLETLYGNVAQYENTHEEYQQARRAGDESRELRLAHELERRAAEVNRSAVRANRSYENASEQAEFDLEDAKQSVGETRTNVTRTQETVRDQTLVRTRLSIRAVDTSGSFTDPVTLEGTLETADGEGIEDDNVTLWIGNRSLRTSTDADGRFELSYRPTVAETGDRSRTFQFRPSNGSANIGASATASFDVEQVTPEVNVSNRTTPIRYNDTLVVNGTVEAGAHGAAAVPVVVTVDGVPMNRTRTDRDGSFGIATRFPASVSAGDRRVAVRVAQSTRALGPANATASIRVESTPTSLSISDTQRSENTVFVAGRLLTDDGEPLANRTVELRANGTTVGTAHTNATGGYAATASISAESADAGSVRVTAVYANESDNLDDAQANATVALPATGPGFGGDSLLVRAAGVLGATAFGAFLVRRLRSDDESTTDDSTGGGADPVVTDAARIGTGDAADESPFDTAREHLDSGRFDAAAVAAYEAVRHRFDAGRATGRTHWDFYDGPAADFPADRRGDLKRLTETYERAAFAPESISGANAAEAVALARSLGSDGDDGRDGAVPSDD